MLGHVPFIVYTTPLTCLIEKHTIRHEMFADDTQLNQSISPENYSDVDRLLGDYVKDTGLWMEENKLKLNNDKTEAVCLSSTAQEPSESRGGRPGLLSPIVSMVSVDVKQD